MVSSMRAIRESIEPHRQLALVIREVTRTLSGSLEGIRAFQRGIMRGTQEYISFDISGLDESAMALVESCAIAFEPMDVVLGDHGLRAIEAACDDILRDCEELTAKVRAADEARSEYQHYMDKVAGMVGQSSVSSMMLGTKDKLLRNQDKLTRAKDKVETTRTECESMCRGFAIRQSVHGRATTHALLQEYVRVFAELGRHAEPLAASFAEELAPGVYAKVVGLTKQTHLNGQVVTVGSQETSGRRVVLLGDGQQKAVSAKNLCPLRNVHSFAAPVATAPVASDELDVTSEGSPSCKATIAAGNQARRMSGDFTFPGTLEPLFVKPSSGLSIGCEAFIQCEGLGAPIDEVLVGGMSAEILEVLPDGVRVRMPPFCEGPEVAGTVDVEVRTKYWQRHIRRSDAGFRYCPIVAFGACGQNVELSAAPSSGDESSVIQQIQAFRKSGILEGVALTASSVPRLALDQDSRRSAKYYFEIEVLELAEYRGTKAMALGFAWPLMEAASSCEGCCASPSDAMAWTQRKWLPEHASELRSSFLVGGDLPRAHLAGKELCKVSGWRPLKDVVEGSVLGALLDVEENVLRLSIFQDGTRRCVVEAPVEGGCMQGPPHGVVDICGALLRVQLRQAAMPPDANDALGSREVISP